MNSKRKIMVNGSSLRLPLTLPGITIVKRGKNVVSTTLIYVSMVLKIILIMLLH